MKKGIDCGFNRKEILRKYKICIFFMKMTKKTKIGCNSNDFMIQYMYASAFLRCDLLKTAILT